MTFLPHPAHWFEVIVPSDQLLPLVERLGASGQVQLEQPQGEWNKLDLEELKNCLQAYHNASKEYGVFWPEPTYQIPTDNTPEVTANKALLKLEQWISENQSLINGLRQLEDKIVSAEYWRTVISHLKQHGIETSSLGSGTSAVSTLLCCGNNELDSFDDALTLSISVDETDCHLALVHPEKHEAFDNHCRAHGIDCQQLPEWIDNSQDLKELKDQLEQEHQHLLSQLESQHERLGLAETLGTLEQLDWLSHHLTELAVTPNLVRVSGWSNIDDESTLQGDLKQAGLHAVLRYTQHPKEQHPPTLLLHHRWIKPFEIFIQAIGMPGEKQIDPSVILAVMVPLMFGYMFGDIGQGLVLTALGWWLKERWPMARLLIWAGLSATFFGWVFGSIFSIEHVVPPLWQTALTSPLDTLAVPMVGGALLLSLGLVLNALQNRWSQDGKLAGFSDLGILISYWGLLLLLFFSEARWILLFGLTLWLIAEIASPTGLRGFAVALGELVEGMFQLTLNTLSFVRVGAFALAHEGLSTAIVSLAQISDSTLVFILVMLLGNIVIIAIEGLIVSIQVTRLVLFEFFVRFFKSGGRPFEPLPPPPSQSKGDHRANHP